MPTRKAVDRNSPITGERLQQLGDVGPCELVHGRVVPMSPTGGRHGRIEFQVATLIWNAVCASRIKGHVLTGEVGIYTRRRPDTVRAADVVFVSAERAARNADPHGFFEVPPDLVVEIMAPGDLHAALEVKAALEAGVVIVLVLDPRTRTAVVHRVGEPAVHECPGHDRVCQEKL